jgi:hypothetical protein
MENSKSVARAVELITGMAREVETKVFVMVKYWRVNRAIEKSENSIWSWRDSDRLNVCHDKIMVGL